MSKIVDSVTAATQSLIESLGYELVEVKYAKEYGQMNLTFFIDNDAGISLDDCEKVHNALDPVIDELDPTSGAPFIMNVSSPGIDRPFKTDRDFKKNLGKLVEVNLYAPIKGVKKFEGFLRYADADKVIITDDDGVETTFERPQISLIRQTIRF